MRKVIPKTMSKKELQDRINDLLKKFWNLDCKDQESVNKWDEQWRETIQIPLIWLANWQEQETTKSG